MRSVEAGFGGVVDAGFGGGRALVDQSGYVYVQVYMCMFMCTHAYVCVYAHMCACVHVCKYLYVFSVPVFGHGNAY